MLFAPENWWESFMTLGTILSEGRVGWVACQSHKEARANDLDVASPANIAPPPPLPVARPQSKWGIF